MAALGTASVSFAMGMGGGGTAPDGTLLVSPIANFGTDGKPVRLALTSSGRVFVADSGRKAILVFSNNGLLVNAFHGVTPQSIASDGNGKIYVGDGASGSVLVYDEDGNFLSQLGSGGASIAPSDIAISQIGHVYVVDGKKNEVRVFPPDNYVPEPDLLSDDFDDGVTGSQWIISGNGNYVTESGGTLNIAKTVSDVGDQLSGYEFASSISGDIDFQVDYSATTGSTSFVAVELRFYAGSDIIFVRENVSAHNFQGGTVIGGVVDSVSSASVSSGSGQLRLKRTGDAATVQYNAGSGWVTLHTVTGFPTGPGVIKLLINVPDTRDISAAFDNFKDNSKMPAGEFAFGGDILLEPMGIAVDGTDVYITDDKAKYVRVFGLNGSYSHGISLSGWVLRPQGIAVDSERLYIADAFNSSLVVFSKVGVFSQYLGNYGGGPGEFRVPLDACFDRDGKLFVADYNNQRVGSLGIGSYINLDIAPSEVSFTLNNADATPYQDISVSSNIPGTPWTAYATEEWMQLSATSGTAPSTVGLTINAGGLPDGNYGGYVVFKTESGVESLVKVSLTVDINYELNVTPSALEFKYQIGSPLYKPDPYPDAGVLVYSSGGSVHWQAQTSVDWLSIPVEGDTPSTVTVAVNQNVEALNKGLYSGTVAFDAGDIAGSPGEVSVLLKVIEAGTIEVTTNLQEAEFELNGEAQYDGKGLYWINDEVEPGDYRIDFINVSGYKKPPSQRFTIHSGEVISINGEYVAKNAESIVAFSGTKMPDTALIADGQGQVQGQVPVLGGRAAAHATVTSASGDLDGDGFDEIAFADVTGYLEVLRPDGSVLVSMDTGSGGVLEVGMADIDSDGRADLLLGRHGAGEVSALGLDGDNHWVQKGTVLELGTGESFNLAAGDLDGDGIDEILVSGRKAVSAYDIDETGSASLLWSVDNPYINVSSIAAGDLDDDGVEEVILGAGANNNCTFRVLRGDGSWTGVEVEAFGDLGFTSGVTVAVGDLDGDFMGEIIAAPGNSPGNRPLIRIFRGDGSLLDATLDILGQEAGGAVVGAGRYVQ